MVRRNSVLTVREPLLTATEVAGALKVCRATVYALVAKGELPAVRILNAVRIRPADLDAFLARRIS